jgi:hypothetical protein
MVVAAVEAACLANPSFLETPAFRWHQQAAQHAGKGDATMDTMIAARLHAYGAPMTLDRIPVPQLRPNDVLVEVHACGIVPNLARS